MRPVAFESYQVDTMYLPFVNRRLESNPRASGMGDPTIDSSDIVAAFAAGQTHFFLVAMYCDVIEFFFRQQHPPVDVKGAVVK